MNLYHFPQYLYRFKIDVSELFTDYLTELLFVEDLMCVAGIVLSPGYSCE